MLEDHRALEGRTICHQSAPDERPGLDYQSHFYHRTRCRQLHGPGSRSRRLDSLLQVQTDAAPTETATRCALKGTRETMPRTPGCSVWVVGHGRSDFDSGTATGIPAECKVGARVARSWTAG